MSRLAVLAILAVSACSAFAQDSCCKKPGEADKKLVAQAQTAPHAHAGAEACCKSTEEKPMVKGGKGCCNEKGAVASFKVFVAGQGYKFYGCKDSAGKARKELIASGVVAGEVQKVSGKARIS